jgi:hypothetical protein
VRRTDLLGGIALLAFSLVMIFVVIPAETAAGVWHGLSPYFYPTVMMAGIAVASVFLVLQAARQRGGGDTPGPPLDLRRLAMFGISAALIVSGVLAIDFFGIWIGGPALIAGTMLFMGERRPLRIVATSLLPVGVVYLIVLYVLRSPLP